MKKSQEENLIIKNIIFDVDGVFTNGKFVYNAEGKIFKEFGAHDSDGIKLLKRAGINVFSVTADSRGFEISKARMHDLGLELYLKNEASRLDWVVENFDLSTTGYMGDGHYDAVILSKVALGIAPMNATQVAKLSANFITPSIGGSGAVYEACIRILEYIGEAY